MIAITDTIALGEDEISFTFIRASGPGGQNVNKVSTAAQLRFDARGSASLPPDLIERLIRLAGARATREGVIVITAHRHRSQERNRAEATRRLVALVARAAVVPTPRRRTRPPRAAAEQRLTAKALRGRVKGFRASPAAEDD